MRYTAWRAIGGVAICLLGVSYALGQPAADPYAEVLKYKFDQPRAAIMAVEEQIRTATPAQLRAIEDKLLALLRLPTATPECKEWACRQLRRAGSERAVPVLAELLADKDLATVARLALQSIPGAPVDAALRGALSKLDGDQLAGLLQTIGARGDRAAVPLVTPLAGDKSPVVAEAALYALGRIGGADALRAVQAATVPAALQRYRTHTLLACADGLAESGQAAEAASLYQQVFQQTEDAVLKSGALRGILLSDKAKAGAAVTAALTSQSARVRLAAAKLACEAGGVEALQPIVAALSASPSDVQAAILGMLCDPAALPAVLAAAKSSNEDVQAAALAALGRLGNVSAVPLLLQSATAGSGSAQASARRSLQTLRGDGVEAAVIAAAQAGAPARRAEALRVLAARGTSDAVPVLLKVAKESDPAVRAEAFNALGILAGSQAVDEMVQLLVGAPSDDVRGAAEQALIATCRRLTDQNAAAESVLRALPGQNAAIRCALLRITARIASNRAIEGLRSAMRDPDPTVRDTAIRGLAEWPTAAAAPDLLALARSAESQVHKVLALRGIIRLATAPRVVPAAESVKLLADVLKLCSRADEKKLVLSALAELKHPAGLELASSCLSDKELEVEAATAVVQIARTVQRSQPDAAAAAVRKVLEVCTAPAARQVAESSLIVLETMANIAPQGTATSPDGFEKDGAASGDQTAIDGDQATYWDEVDGKELYRLVVTFKQPQKITAFSIIGYAHHRFAPKDFQVLVDDKLVRDVKGARYDDNLLLIKVAEVTGTTVELRITGYYGGSPAIRELGIYRPVVQK